MAKILAYLDFPNVNQNDPERVERLRFYAAGEQVEVSGIPCTIEVIPSLSQSGAGMREKIAQEFYNANFAKNIAWESAPLHNGWAVKESFKFADQILLLFEAKQQEAIKAWSDKLLGWSITRNDHG